MQTIVNALMPASIPLGDELIEVSVIFDYVDRQVYINAIVYDDRDIKCIVSDSVEEQLIGIIIHKINEGGKQVAG